MASCNELFEAGGNLDRQLPRALQPDAPLEDRQACTLLLLAVMNEQLAQHANARGEREVVAGTCEEETLEREAEKRMLFEGALLGPHGAMRERVNELLFGERVPDDFIGERSDGAAHGGLFGLVEELDDATMLVFENGLER